MIHGDYAIDTGERSTSTEKMYSSDLVFGIRRNFNNDGKYKVSIIKNRYGGTLKGDLDELRYFMVDLMEKLLHCENDILQSPAIEEIKQSIKIIFEKYKIE
jgi:hypothetical protein